ncbi:FlaA1/EpsC-like NDP-sugar epimerase [Chryseobacterium sp. SORGH_AS 447]|uniref:hypothetical protein n=1 Tax=Chryseobacterium sp. SORGH_AS_0447 TaxID=3041769 RepID=UPI00277EA18C|nr:hypothetical protein [Chryseobacterium sp. SORGH_AS_0447]MDQ1161034.1 FlaA1/EpsC-like NDP-sugar epimerase [Chryseobacterium sp. SORGH_AS_0447]
MLAYLFKHLPRIFLIIDYITINCLFIFGKLYFFEFDYKDFAQEFRTQLILINISWFVITLITKPYKSLKVKESSLHFNALSKAFILFIFASAIFPSLIFSVKINYRNVIVYFLLLGFFITFTRFLLFLYRKRNRVRLGRKLYSFHTVLVGENKLSTSLISNNDLRRAIGIRGTYTPLSKETKNKYLGGIDQLFHDLENTKINNIIFCDDNIEVDIYKKIVDIAEHKMIRIYMVPDFKYANLGPNYFDVINEIPFIKLIREPLSNPKKQFLKRSFDIAFSLFAIIFLLSWLVPLVALIVKIESNESVFVYTKEIRSK